MESPFAQYDIYAADECFLTGTAAEVVPVVKVDSREISQGVPGPVTTRLIKLFREYAKSTGVPIYP